MDTLSYNDYLSALTNGTCEAAIAWTNPGPTPYHLYSSLLAGSNTEPNGPGAAPNWERWSDPGTDQVLERYVATPDPNVQQQALFGLEQVMVGQVSAIPLIDQVNWCEYSTARFAGWPDANHP